MTLLTPIVRAFQQGTEKAQPWENASTLADGLRVPRAIGDFLILRAVRESGGTAVAVSDRPEAAIQIQARTFSEAAVRTRSHKGRDCGFVPIVPAGRPLAVWLRWGKAGPADRRRPAGAASCPSTRTVIRARA